MTTTVEGLAAPRQMSIKWQSPTTKSIVAEILQDYSMSRNEERGGGAQETVPAGYFLPRTGIVADAGVLTYHDRNRD